MNSDWPEKVIPNPQILSRWLIDELVLFHRETEASCVLDPVAAQIWKALIEESSVESAFNRIMELYAVDESRLKEDFGALMANLVENDWVSLETQ